MWLPYRGPIFPHIPHCWRIYTPFSKTNLLRFQYRYLISTRIDPPFSRTDLFGPPIGTSYSPTHQWRRIDRPFSKTGPLWLSHRNLIYPNPHRWRRVGPPFPKRTCCGCHIGTSYPPLVAQQPSRFLRTGLLRLPYRTLYFNIPTTGGASTAISPN